MSATRLAAIAVLLSLAAPLRAEEATDTFNRLFAEELKAAGKSKEASVALAAKMLDAARKAEANPPLLALLCKEACELGAKDPRGYETALAAAELLASNAPQKAAACQERALAIRQQQYARARGDDKVKTGEALLGILLATASDKARAGDLEDALQRCRQALTVARSIKSPNVEGIGAHIKHLTQQQKVAGKVPQLKEDLEAQPTDRAKRSELIRLLLVELDNPEEAARYVDATCESDIQKYVPAAAQGVDLAPEMACPVLANWYLGLSQAEETSPGGKACMLLRAKAYCERFLAIHTGEDAERSTAAVTLKKAEADLKELGGAAWTPPPRMVGTGQWIDLLAAADPSKDAQGGAWKRTAEGIEFACGGKDPGLAFPVVLDGGYEWEFRFTKRNEGGNALFAVLPAGSASVALIWSGSLPRLENVNREPCVANAPGARVPPDAWKGGRPCTVLVRVAPVRDQATISVSFDGQLQLTWTGPQAALSVAGPAAALPKGRPALGADFVSGLVQSARVRMLTGRAIPIRPGESAPKPASAPTQPQ